MSVNLTADRTAARHIEWTIMKVDFVIVTWCRISSLVELGFATLRQALVSDVRTLRQDAKAPRKHVRDDPAETVHSQNGDRIIYRARCIMSGL